MLRSLREYLATSHHWSPGGERHGKRRHSTIFLKRMREGHHQSDKLWNSLKKGNVVETSERRGGVYVGLLEPTDVL